jgi:hypothetical protein
MPMCLTFVMIVIFTKQQKLYSQAVTIHCAMPPNQLLLKENNEFFKFCKAHCFFNDKSVVPDNFKK